MRPLAYFDLEIRGTHMGEGAILSIPAMGRLLRNLHGYFANNPNKFAIAFPKLRTNKFRHPGNVIRVFTEHRDDFDGLIEWIENNPSVAPYVIKSYPCIVNEKNIIGWMEYRRYRIPSRNSRLEACREYRMTSSVNYPYIKIASSSKESFSMHIAAIEGSKTEECKPTSYGLSGINRFTLPVLK